MPSPKRWFPTSRDINHDAELWELTDTFGDRSLRTWLEVLAILDRVDNFWQLSGQWLAGLSRTTRQKSTSIQRQLGWMVAKGWLVVSETLPDGSPAAYSAKNYLKYHRTPEISGAKHIFPSGARLAPPLPCPNRTKPSSSEKSAVHAGDKQNGSEEASMKGEGFHSLSSIITEFKNRSSS